MSHHLVYHFIKSMKGRMFLVDYFKKLEITIGCTLYLPFSLKPSHFVINHKEFRVVTVIIHRFNVLVMLTQFTFTYV